MIETGLFSLCLDSPVMRISDEKYVYTHTHRVFLCLLNQLSNAVCADIIVSYGGLETLHNYHYPYLSYCSI